MRFLPVIEEEQYVNKRVLWDQNERESGTNAV